MELGFGARPGQEETGGVGAPAGWRFSWVGVVEKRDEICRRGDLK